MSLAGHWFWLILTLACLLWYSTVTVYVAAKGAVDIRTMLRRLREQGDEDAAKPTPPKSETTYSPNHR